RGNRSSSRAGRGVDDQCLKKSVAAALADASVDRATREIAGKAPCFRNRRSEAPQSLPMSSDPSRLIAGLARDRIQLDLNTLDLCFLAGLYLRADRASLASFEEDALVDLFEQVCDVVDPGAERPRTRATHAIQRLRDQRMLARVDGAGIVRSGEYTLTRLAAAVVEYFLADEALTRESLTLLTGT